VERTLHPLGIVLKGGVWYLVAGTEGQDRTYRISRIATLQPLDEPGRTP
jgi:predicted DNA-binding transcriptional regulator YafY